jgi:enoyl-CoA hydratase/carnithine racemase
MMPRMPFGELMRMTLMGTSERMSARRAHEIGLVSEVVSGPELLNAALETARVIASHPPRPVQATVRTLWAAREMPNRQALELGAEFLNLGTSAEEMRKGQERFRAGERKEPRVR